MSHIERGRICQCGREVDRPGRATKCSLCISAKSSASKAIRGRVCAWCGESFTGKARVYCTPFCRSTANTAAKLSRAGSLVPDEKYCKRCDRVRPAHMFNIHIESRDGLSSICRTCTSEKHKEWRERPENRDKIREGNLIRNYGITIADYDKMLKSQGGRCAMCSKRPEDQKRRFSVDHDHETGAIRSLACDRCNKFKISNLTLDDVDKLYEYFHNPPADRAFGERRFVPKGMEQGQKKRKQPRKKDRRKI